jgi:hypothetical protein
LLAGVLPVKLLSEALGGVLSLILRDTRSGMLVSLESFDLLLIMPLPSEKTLLLWREGAPS